VPERRRAAPKTSERLGRMLVIVPYLVQHPGTALGEAARLFDVPADQLRRDLDLLFMSGLPPYGPGDLIDVEVDEQDRISIKMADHFSRPLRLTRNEALALYLRGTELVATPGLPDAPALASALQKLRDTLGAETLGVDVRVESAAADERSPEHLETLRAAAAEHRQLEIEYFAGSTGEWTTRRVDPEEVFWSLGNWYVAAWDTGADAERLFRADRIRGATLTSETFEPRGLEGAGRALYTPTPSDVPVRLRLKPAARWVAEYYATTDPVEQNGALEVTLPARQLGWVAQLLLRVGPDAEIVAPAELADEVRELAARTLARYST
jgi:proteasome accessory factor C